MLDLRRSNRHRYRHPIAIASSTLTSTKPSLMMALFLGLLCTLGCLVPASSKASIAGWPTTHVLPDGTSSSVGNHRFAITFEDMNVASMGIAMVTIPWRRRDDNPEAVDAFIVETRSHLLVPSCTRISSSTNNGTFVFQAQPWSEYHLYYRPFTTCEFEGGTCAYGANVDYTPTVNCQDGTAWYQPVPTSDMATPKHVQYQSRTSFSSFTDMERPATVIEIDQFVKSVAPLHSVMLVAEDRMHPIRMSESIPYKWTLRNTSLISMTTGVAQPGEAFTFQLGVFATQTDTMVSSATFSDLTSAEGTINKANVSCLNFDGLDFWGNKYTPASDLLVQAGGVGALWISVDVPLSAKADNYTGTVSVKVSVKGSSTPLVLTAKVVIEVVSTPVANNGDNDLWRGSRLTWLNSDLGQAGDDVPSPYVPLKANGTATDLTVTMLDKVISIGTLGLIDAATIGVFASKQHNNYENAVQANVLASPTTLLLNGDIATKISFKPGTTTNMSTSWTATSRFASAFTTVTLQASVDCTGYADFVANMVVDAGKTLPVGSVISLSVPSNPNNALMAMGLGVDGGYIDELPPPQIRGAPEWLVFDFDKPITADALGLIAAGDSVHDPELMQLETATSLSGPWNPVTSLTATPGVTTRQTLKFGDQMTVHSQYWRLVIISNIVSSMCLPLKFCQSWVAEINFRDSNTHEWINNTQATSTHRVVQSSGSAAPKNPASKAADGILTFVQGAEGWDASFAPLPRIKSKNDGDSNNNTNNNDNNNNDIAIDWYWDGVNGNNAVWSGSSSAGLRLFLKGSEPEWQAAVPFDSKSTPPIADLLWNNDGNGGIRLYKNGSIIASTGALNTSLTNFDLRWSMMFTPVRPLNLSKHFQERYAQLGGPANYTYLAEQGATVVNMHQGNAINPWINYPYETNRLMKSVANECHAVGLRFKIYNTMRELSNRCREIWAMRAFNETYVLPDTNAPSTSGADWLKEHVVNNFEVAWSNPVVNQYPGSSAAEAPPIVSAWVDHAHEQDAAIKVKALSRWNNYYVAGLRQMKIDFGYDGIYLDEIAYDRVTMLRSKKMLGVSGLIDHHSDKGGFTNSPTSNYLELYPFIDSLWYGEGFNYETSSSSFWLCEMSGVPHGLNSDMLRYTGMVPAHFKGMLVASANRWQAALNAPPDQDPFNPRNIWRLWDSFGIARATMFGWWLERERGVGTVPITTSNSSVKVTSYVKQGNATLVAIASFATVDITITLTIDFTKLGLNANTATLVAPVLIPMQPTSHVFKHNDSIPVVAGQGWILILS